MPPVLTTLPGDPHKEISGLPVLAADGRGGVPLARAAEVLSQLQDSNGYPLEGDALEAAGEDLAQALSLRVVDLSEAKIEALPLIAGGFPDRPPAAEVAEANHDALYGPLEEDAPAAPEQPDPDPEPFEGYDALNAVDVVARLADLDVDGLAAVKAYEAAHKDRKTILEYEAPAPTGTAGDNTDPQTTPPQEG